MNALNKGEGGALIRLTEKLQLLNKLILEGASMDWIMDVFITTTVLAQEQVLDTDVLN